jgi:hypothetical protein
LPVSESGADGIPIFAVVWIMRRRGGWLQAERHRTFGDFGASPRAIAGYLGPRRPWTGKPALNLASPLARPFAAITSQR